MLYLVKSISPLFSLLRLSFKNLMSDFAFFFFGLVDRQSQKAQLWSDFMYIFYDWALKTFNELRYIFIFLFCHLGQLSIAM